MNFDIKDLLDEFNTFVSKKTIDALFSPLIFAAANRLFGLKTAAVLALTAAALIASRRLYKRQKTTYALLGFFSVFILSLLSYMTQNAANYYLGGLISSFTFAFCILTSLLLKKPAAAMLSHLSRGWPLDWFFRKDVIPAYVEVTCIWGLVFTLRGLLQLSLYQKGNVTALALTNFFLGFPFTTSLLIGSYLYGLFRLKQLKGPSVDEYLTQQKPPFKGQRKGF